MRIREGKIIDLIDEVNKLSNDLETTRSKNQLHWKEALTVVDLHHAREDYNKVLDEKDALILEE